MPTVRAGKLPGSGQDLQWNLSTGWAPKPPRGWTKGVKRHQRTLHGADGETYKLYYYPGTDYHLGFYPKDDQNRLAQAEDAFSADNASHGEIISQKGCGHITQLDYAVREKILRVEFENDGAICLFFEVPTQVAGELIHLAESGATRKRDGRHLLGIRFWDYIRIRGQRHGAKYPFEYERFSDGMIDRRMGRHVVTLNDENELRAVFGDKLQGMKKMFKGLTNENRKVTVVMSDDELAEYAEALKGIKGEKGSWYLQAYGSTTGEAYLDTANSYNNQKRVGDGIQSDAPIVQFANGLIAASKENANNVNSQLASDVRYYVGEGMSDRKARIQAIKDFRRDVAENGEDSFSKQFEAMLRIYDQRYGGARGIRNMDQLKAYARAMGYGDELDSWLKKSPARNARKFTGRVWTKQELMDFANDTVPGNIAPGHDAVMYKGLIKAKDWQGALDYLKGHGTTVTYTANRKQRDESGRYNYVTKHEYKRYAGPNDQVDEGD